MYVSFVSMRLQVYLFIFQRVVNTIYTPNRVGDCNHNIASTKIHEGFRSFLRLLPNPFRYCCAPESVNHIASRKTHHNIPHTLNRTGFCKAYNASTKIYKGFGCVLRLLPNHLCCCCAPESSRHLRHSWYSRSPSR